VEGPWTHLLTLATVPGERFTPRQETVGEGKTPPQEPKFTWDFPVFLVLPVRFWAVPSRHQLHRATRTPHMSPGLCAALDLQSCGCSKLSGNRFLLLQNCPSYRVYLTETLEKLHVFKRHGSHQIRKPPGMTSKQMWVAQSTASFCLLFLTSLAFHVPPLSTDHCLIPAIFKQGFQDKQGYSFLKIISKDERENLVENEDPTEPCKGVVTAPDLRCFSGSQADCRIC
jgi:hypothetical protein